MSQEHGDEPSQRWHSLRVFRNSGYRRLWAGITVNGFAIWINRVAVGWFVFDQTNSALLTAISFAMQSAPGVLVAPIGGAVADRIDRRHVLAGAALMKGMTALGLAYAAIDGIESAWIVIALQAVTGALNSFELPASQALIPDVVGPRDAMNGIAVCSVGVRAVSACGALTGGYLLELFGPPTAFVAVAVLHWVAAAIVVRVRAPKRPQDPGTPTRSVIADTKEGLRIMDSEGLPVTSKAKFTNLPPSGQVTLEVAEGPLPPDLCHDHEVAPSGAKGVAFVSPLDRWRSADREAESGCLRCDRSCGC